MVTRASLWALLFFACGPTAGPNYPAAQAGEPPRTAADGEVIGVDQVPPSDRLASGFRLRLGGEKPMVVDLAPDWYLDQNGIRFSPSERVHVEGHRVERSGQSVLYATSVTKGEKTVELRDRDGNPLWIAPPLTPKK